MSAFAFADRLVNLVSGAGTSKDKAIATTWGCEVLGPEELRNAYRSDWLARKIVDIPAFDMVREGRNWQAKDDQIELIEAEEARLQLWTKLARALRLARLWGGSAMILGTGDMDTRQPLDPNRVGKAGLRFIHVASRHEITAGEVERDPASPYWGTPKDYSMSSASGDTVVLHPSRVVRFIGAEVADIGYAEPWGDSVLQVVGEAVKSAGTTIAGIANLVMEAKVDVYRIPDFMANVGDAAYRAKVLERVRLGQIGKSTVNGLLMDKDEEYEQKTVSFGQLPEILDRYLQIAAGAADIPATRLLGQSPAGMNATGESDLRNYYDRLAADQELMLRPALAVLDECLIRSALGARPPEVHYAFAPLWQISETEKATIFKTKADAARAIAGTGGASPALMPIEALSDALVNSLVEDGILPGLEAAIDEYGRLSEQPDESDEEMAAAGRDPGETNGGAPVGDATFR
jgi:phage-related protein (TIGR01555 family)